VTFHGPVASSSFTDYATNHLRALLMEGQSNIVISMAEENHERGLTTPAFAARTLVPGRAQGRLVGGNLSLVSALSGTPYAARFAGKLLFLEDIGEAPYRIDRMMTQLHLTQNYNSAAALMLGVFLKCEATDGEPSLTLAETVDDLLSTLKVPAVQGYSFGHIAQQFTLPMGIMARLDTQQQTLTLLEAAVHS
jgi:muramoyltetrapeptide carboxypeptidase